MKTTKLWTQILQFPENNGDNSIYDICFSPNGATMLVSVGMRIAIYNTSDWSLITSLKSHKSTVHCLSFSTDGTSFASGGSDKQVIIWRSNYEATLKYQHGESIQCLEFSPLNLVLVSCSLADFALWTSEKKSVDKVKVSSRINACRWTPDGSYFALGLGNGIVSLRTKTGSEFIKIERPGGSSSPIWGLTWGHSPEDGGDMICIADWGQSLSFYDLKGKQIGKERSLDFDPVRVVYARTHRDCEYVVVTGSNKTCAIYTPEGIFVTNVAEQESWIWACTMKPNSNIMAIGTSGGVVSCYEIQLIVVHALYKSLYAYRLNMTDVMVQNLLQDLRVRIKCRDVVKKLGIFKESLAIQFADRVMIYQRDERSEDEFKYHLKEKINQSFECSLLVMGTENLILCQDKKLSCYSFKGTRTQEWVLESNIRYIRSLGGLKGKEVLLAGLKTGHVVKIFLHNVFPMNLVKVSTSVRCVDVNLTHTKIAVIDESNTLYVYSLKNKQLLYQESNAISVFWNLYCEQLLSFSGQGILNIKAGSFPLYQQKMGGFVVGFAGPKIFSMQNSSVVTIEVPLSVPMFQYMKNKEFNNAFKIACLGVPKNDWITLGNAALEGQDLAIAKKAFSKVKNFKFLKLIASHEEKLKRGEESFGVFLAEIYAHQGRFLEAAKLFKDNKMAHRAMAMYADLRMFDLAQECLNSTGGADSGGGGKSGDSLDKDKIALMKMKADWALKINEPRVAAEMYLVAGEKAKAIQIVGENNWTDMLIGISRKLDPSETDALAKCADWLVQLGQVSTAVEMFKRLQLIERVLEMYISMKEWQEAFLIASKFPNLKKAAYLPYAQWLAESDRFAESQKAFLEAGCPEEAFNVLDQLRKNSMIETRFMDTAYYHWILSMQYLELAGVETDPALQTKHLATFRLHQKKSGMYYAYDAIYKYTDQPFTPFGADALFNISKFLTHELMTVDEKDISKFLVLFTLAKHARFVDAFKLATFILDRLKAIAVPDQMVTQVYTLKKMSRCDKPEDNEDLLPMCYRCYTRNPLFNPKGNQCINCQHEFVFSFISFEVLPLVEFQLEEGISDEEALGLIGSRLLTTTVPKTDGGGGGGGDSYNGGSNYRRKKSSGRGGGRIHSGSRQLNNPPRSSSGAGSRWKELNGSTSTNNSMDNLDLQILAFDDANDNDNDNNAIDVGDSGPNNLIGLTNNFGSSGGMLPSGIPDPFSTKAVTLKDDKVVFSPVIVGREALRYLEPNEVIVCKWPLPLRYTFYKNLIPDMTVSQCHGCFKVFHTDDFIIKLLQKGSCPFCRTPSRNREVSPQSRKNF